MKWITRSHVHLDRVACPWLIKRFIDSEAQFIFVSKSQVAEAAKREGAISYDAPNAEYQHEGELCTFSVMIKRFDLTDKALLRMAKVVNAADTNRFEKDPLAAGFEAVAVGFGIRFPDDKKNLEYQFEIYDALYAWCRLETTGE